MCACSALPTSYKLSQEGYIVDELHRFPLGWGGGWQERDCLLCIFKNFLNLELCGVITC